MLPKVINYLFEAGHSAISVDNSKPWKFSFQDETITISYDIMRVPYLLFSYDSTSCLLAFGSVIENIKQAAISVGLQIDWTLHPTHTNNYTYAEGRVLNIAEKTNINYEHALFRRHSNKSSYKRKLLPTSILNGLQNQKIENARIKVLDSKIAIKEVAKLIKDSSKIRFQTEEVHSWSMTHLHFNPFEENSMDIKVSLPTKEKTFLEFVKPWRNLNLLNRLGAYNFMAYQEQIPIARAPALIAIIGHSGFNNGIYAGALLQNIWTKLNTFGIAVQSYNVITDQIEKNKIGKTPPHLKKLANSLSKETRRIFDLNNDEKLLMLLRIGYPKHDSSET